MLSTGHKKNLVAQTPIWGAVAIITILFPLSFVNAAEDATPSTPSEPEIFETNLTPKLSVPIPDLRFSEVQVQHTGKETREIDVPWIADYLAAVYEFGVAIAGGIAAVIMMIGGFQYLTAGGDAARVSAAKKRIADALVGLLLSLGVYTILYTINPEMLKMDALHIRVIERVEFIANETNDFSDADAACADSGGMGANNVPILKQGCYKTLNYLNSNTPKCQSNPDTGKAYTVSSSGCGISSASMIIGKYTGASADTTLRKLLVIADTNPDVRTCNNACTSCNGTAFGPLSGPLKTEFSMKTNFTKSASEVKSKLAQGKPVIALVGPSIFTSGGHYIVLTGFSNGNYSINDPYRSKYTKDCSEKGSDGKCKVLETPLNMQSIPAHHVEGHAKSFIILEPI